MKRKPEESIRIYAAGLILQQLESLAAEINGVKKARDIEYVHRMRVSTRRLRAILEVFEDCLPAKRGADLAAEGKRHYQSPRSCT